MLLSLMRELLKQKLFLYKLLLSENPQRLNISLSKNLKPNISTQLYVDLFDQVVQKLNHKQ